MTPKYNPDKHHRRSIRLRGWDYRNAGAYFVTICACGGEPLFGDVVDGDMRLNMYGEIVEACWHAIPHHFANVEMDAFVVMPNHMHGIIVLRRGDACVAPTTPASGPAPQSLGAIVGSFKSACTRRINRARGTPGALVWQRNYWEHIIRDDRALNAVRQYIADNPARWTLDKYNPAADGEDPQARALWDVLREKEIES